MLVIHPVGRGIKDAVAPRHAPEFLIPFVPQQRIAAAGDGEDVDAGAMAMALFVSREGNLGGMCVHGAVGKDEGERGRPGAARIPGLEPEIGKIGDEVGLPHVPAGTHWGELALAVEERRLADTLGEIVRVLEDEFLVVDEVHDQRQVMGGGEQGAVLTRAVEMAVFHVERQGEEALGTPFEAVLAPLGGFDGGAAVPFDDVDHQFEHVFGRRAHAARS